MVAPRSQIPHLARAIFEKRCLQTRIVDSTCVSPHPSASAFVHQQSVRYASSGFPKARKPSLPQSGSTPVKTRPADITNIPAKPSSDPTKDAKQMRRALYIFLTGASLMGAWAAYVLVSAVQDLKQYKLRDDQLLQDEDVSDRWLRKDRDHDAEVDSAEKWMLMRPKRKRLIREAYGDVLEVSVGTGRNMDLFDTRPYSGSEDSSYGRSRRHMITSITFNDQSPVMIENAKRKWDAKQKEKRQEDRFIGNVDWVIGDAGDSKVVKRPPGGFDTIVQSYGICSMKDPVRFLKHLSSLVRQPGEHVQNASTSRMRQEDDDGHGGRIFLLEHGKGHYEWLNSFLDNIAPVHADRYGCWFNKDIQRVIETSGLTVERIRRYHAGTTWEIVLRPTPVPLETAQEPSKPTTTTPSPEQRNSNSWWKIWR